MVHLLHRLYGVDAPDSRSVLCVHSVMPAAVCPVVVLPRVQCSTHHSRAPQTTTLTSPHSTACIAQCLPSFARVSWFISTTYSSTLQSHLCKSHRCCKSSNISTFTTVYGTTHPKTIKLISLQSTLRARSSQSHSRSNTALQSPRNAARFISANISLHLGTVDTR